MPYRRANTVHPTGRYRTVGTRPVRHDGADKVSGKARYSADMDMPGLLQARVLRSPHAHARIRSVNTEKARQLPGVKAVITAADFADLARSDEMYFTSCNTMAKDKVLYKGHALAAVAASNVHIAEEALERIEVDYEVLPPVFDGMQAMQASAPVLHDQLPGSTPAAHDSAAHPPNVADLYVFELGDAAAGFAAANLVVEKTTRTVSVHQGYIEPHAATALWHDDGRLTLWASSQGPFSMREETAAMVGVPVSMVKVVPMEIGGGFGGKLQFYAEPVAALLARQAGAPVRLTMKRHEIFEATGPAAGTHIKLKIGATDRGRLVAAEATLVYEAGAFPGSLVQYGALSLFAPYDIAHARITAYDVVVNRPQTAPYRAPGGPPAAFAMETAMDELAESLGMDPLALRLLNSARQGTRWITGQPLPQVGMVETLEAAKAHPHYKEKLTGPWRGRGVASGCCGHNAQASSAVLTVNPDGTAILSTGSPDIGGTRTSVAQQVAETLGLPAEAVWPQIVDTDTIGYTSDTSGSSVTFKTGWAACAAAEDIKRQMIERAALLWEIEADGVEYVEGSFRQREAPSRRLDFAEIAARQDETGGALVGRAGVHPGGFNLMPATHIVDVEVDPETGKVTILRYTAVQDAGKAVHPSYVEGQMQGGVAQGIGWALNEEYCVDAAGQMLNATFLDYRMPTSLDLPMIDTVIVEVPNPKHPYGVRGVGEVPIVPPAAALANALYAATGVRFTELPMKPERIWAALAQQ